MKPRGWRRYFWYRPPVFLPIPMRAEELETQATAYCQWLAEARGISVEEAKARVEAQRQPIKTAPDYSETIPEPPLL